MSAEAEAEVRAYDALADPSSMEYRVHEICEAVFAASAIARAEAHEEE